MVQNFNIKSINKIKENDDSEKHLYLIVKGKVELFFESQEKKTMFKTLNQNMSFGELAFITGGTHDFSARSLECSQLIKIDREEFFEILQKFPEDKERFMMIRDSLLFYNDYELSNLHCYSCGKSTHLINNCPFVTYYPDKDFIIKKHVYSQPQKRKAFIRRNKKSLNSLIIKNDLEELIKMKKKAEKNEKITFFFEQSSIRDTIHLDDTSISNLNFDNSSNILQRRASTVSLPSQVGILKHYRQSRDFSNACKRTVSFIAPKEIDTKNIIKEEKTIVEEEKSEKSISDSNSNEDQEEMQQGSIEINLLKEEEKDDRKEEKVWSMEFSDNFNVMSQTRQDKDKEIRFDKIKSFRFYFPYNNLEEILYEMQKIKNKKLKMNQFYFRKALILSKITKMLAKQKRRSRAGVKNNILGKTFNFFRIVQRK